MNLLVGLTLIIAPLAVVFCTTRVAAIVFYNISFLTQKERIELALPQAIIAMFLIWIPFLAFESRTDLVGLFENRFYTEKHVDPSESAAKLNQFLTYGTIWVCLTLSPAMFVTTRFWATWSRQYKLSLSLIPFLFSFCGMATVAYVRLASPLEVTGSKMLVWPSVLVTCFAVFTAVDATAPIGILLGSAFYAWISSIYVASLLPVRFPAGGVIGALLPWLVFLGLCMAHGILLQASTYESSG